MKCNAKRFFFYYLLLTATFSLPNLARSQGWAALNYPVEFSLSGVAFADTNNGWAVGYHGYVLHTTDHGVSWNQQFLDTPYTGQLNSVYFSDINHGYISADQNEAGQNVFFTTTNGGATWVTRNLGYLNYGLYKLACIDTSKVWAAGDAGVFRSNDGGITWTHPNPNFYLSGIAFPDSTHGWAVGGSGSILHTTDGGVSWTTQNSGTISASFFAVSFSDTNNGWAVGALGASYGHIVHTVDGGVTWTNQAIGTTKWLHDVTFLDNNNGWVVGDSCTILHTTNGGNNWFDQSYNSNSSLYSVSFTAANNGWAAGGGIILHYTGTDWVAEPRGSGLPTTPTLHQNYPNPFNSATTISFSLPKAVNVSISIFDVSGRNIRTLFKGYRSAGNQRVTFDGKRLPSGEYFYRLKAGSVSETKKLNLIR